MSTLQYGAPELLYNRWSFAILHYLSQQIKCLEPMEAGELSMVQLQIYNNSSNL